MPLHPAVYGSQLKDMFLAGRRMRSEHAPLSFSAVQGPADGCACRLEKEQFSARRLCQTVTLFTSIIQGSLQGPAGTFSALLPSLTCCVF